MQEKKIALIGTYPPPYGGISIHIKRLKNKLEKNGFKCIVYSFSMETYVDANVKTINNPIKWIVSYLITNDDDIIHLHAPDWRLRFILSLMAIFNKRVIISIHGDSLNDALKSNYIKKLLVKFSIRYSSTVIAVNTKIRDLCLEIGVKPNRLYLISPFIPPKLDDNDLKLIPNEVNKFIKDHDPIISVNAFKLVFYKGEDLYGLDMCVDLCNHLKSTYKKIGFIVSIPEIGNYEYFNELIEKIDKKDLRNNFFFKTDKLSFYPIIYKSDIFLRPTNTDGDAVSIREALYFNVPTVTSDVVPRPEGTILFKNRDINDLTVKVLEVLKNYEFYKNKMEISNKVDNFEKIVDVYKKLIIRGE
jgi:glycosyltransferase involved in cell wall biosynthesis